MLTGYGYKNDNAMKCKAQKQTQSGLKRLFLCSIKPIKSFLLSKGTTGADVNGQPRLHQSTTCCYGIHLAPLETTIANI